MLEIRPSCENCNKSLPNTSDNAMICTFECTYCSDCVTNILYNVCQNCGGGFEKRPTRPKEYIEKFPASKKLIYNPIKASFKKLLMQFKSVNPRKR